MTFRFAAVLLTGLAAAVGTAVGLWASPIEFALFAAAAPALLIAVASGSVVRVPSYAIA